MLNLNKIAASNSAISAIKNTFWLVGEKLLSMLLVLAVSIFVARHLGAESFGLLNYLLAIIAICAPLSSLGLNAIVTRELVKKVHSDLVIMSTVTIYRVLGGLCALLLLVVAVWFELFSRLDNLYWGVLLLSVTNIFVAFHVIDFWFQAKVQSRYVVKMRLACVVLVSCIKLTLVYIDASLSAFIWVAAVESLIVSVGFLVIYFFKQGIFNLNSINWAYGWQLLQQSKWLILSGIASVIYLKIDQVMLTQMVSAQENGIYAVASRLSEVWYFFPTALVASFFPSLLKTKEVSEVKYQVKLQRLCDYLFFGALFIAIVISLSAEYLVTFLYGKEYMEAGVILTFHIWAGLFVFMRALLSKWLLAENLVFFSLVTHGTGAIINVGLNYYLIPLYQGQGAAIATVVSYAFASYIVLMFHSSTWPMAKIMTKSIFWPVRYILKK